MTLIKCIYCNDEKAVKNGLDKNGEQRYKCTCGQTFSIRSTIHPDSQRKKRIVSHLLLLGYKEEDISSQMALDKELINSWQRKYLPKLNNVLNPGRLIDIHYAYNYISALDKGSRPQRINENQTKSGKPTIKKSIRKKT
ncbi:MAG: IS1 family transposase [Pedobacter sp.]|nr:MAG: IS1 family transposase [Pedobacter sp.]